MRKSLQIALMTMPALAISFLPFVLNAEAASGVNSAASGAIAVSEENGRKVYVNDVPASTPARRKKPQARNERGLLYWSVTEQRYKPVPSANGSLMRAARSAAAEVRKYLSTGTYRSAPSGYSARPYFVSSEQVNAAIEEAAARHDVDPNLVRAVVKVESNFNAHAVSSKGAMGLMQLMPSTARELNVSNPFDPQQNVSAGVRHLRHLLDSYGGD